jgi:hypothetical protein
VAGDLTDRRVAAQNPIVNESGIRRRMGGRLWRAVCVPRHCCCFALLSAPPYLRTACPADLGMRVMRQRRKRPLKTTLPRYTSLAVCLWLSWTKFPPTGPRHRVGYWAIRSPTRNSQAACDACPACESAAGRLVTRQVPEALKRCIRLKAAAGTSSMTCIVNRAVTVCNDLAHLMYSHLDRFVPNSVGNQTPQSLVPKILAKTD